MTSPKRSTPATVRGRALTTRWLAPNWPNDISTFATSSGEPVITESSGSAVSPGPSGCATVPTVSSRVAGSRPTASHAASIFFQASLTIAAVNQFIWPLPDKGLSKRLHRIKADTLLVWGRQDRLVHPAYGDDFLRRIPGARLELVDGAGHLPQLEQFDQVAALIEGFLS